MFRYHNFFYGYCFCCFNLGHKAANCDFNFKSMRQRISRTNQMMHHGVRQSLRKQDHYIIPPSNRRGIHDRNVNPCDLL